MCIDISSMIRTPSVPQFPEDHNLECTLETSQPRSSRKHPDAFPFLGLPVMHQWSEHSRARPAYATALVAELVARGLVLEARQRLTILAENGWIRQQRVPIRPVGTRLVVGDGASGCAWFLSTLWWSNTIKNNEFSIARLLRQMVIPKQHDQNQAERRKL